MRLRVANKPGTEVSAWILIKGTTSIDGAENQIVIEGGANQRIEKNAIEQTLSQANPQSDWVLLQNKTNLADHIVNTAAERGCKIAYADAPR